jgi:hypothetical protein
MYKRGPQDFPTGSSRGNLFIRTHESGGFSLAALGVSVDTKGETLFPTS